MNAVAERARRRRREPLRQRGDLRLRAREQPQRRQALGEPIGIAIEPQRRLERGEPHLVDAQRALHRVAVDLRDQVLAADDEAGLRAAEQLVAGEGDEVGAVGDRLRDGRLVREAEAREIDQRAGAEIVAPAARCARARCAASSRAGDLRGEALDAVVGGVDLEDQPGALADRRRRSPSGACGWWCRPRPASRRRAP